MKKLALKLSALPNLPGVYLFKDKKGDILYVGKATSLRSRVRSYFQAKALLGPKTITLVQRTFNVEWIPVESELEALLLEAELIKKYLPRFNTRAKDDKSPLYIKVTREEFPKVATTRLSEVRQDPTHLNVYFGPFPKAAVARRLLRLLRRIFPYCQQKQIGVRPCFWSFIGLCRPCPAFIVKQPQSQKIELTKIYKNNIKKLIWVLEGNTKAVVAELTAQMQILAQDEKFEKAKELREKIKLLANLSSPYTPTTAYIENPNLIEDRREQEILELYELLKTRAKLKVLPRRIECFDASHIAGTAPTVASVTFRDGEPDKTFYRRFKIKRKGRDDLALLSEGILRRFSHKEWGVPDLLVIDGGKGQVKTAKEILGEKGIRVAVIGLAKQFENVIIPKKEGFLILRPNVDSGSLKLLQRIRNEAHRFARAYHHLLRRKELTLQQA